MANVYPTCTYQENWGSYQEVRMTNMPNGARAEAETVCNKIKYINSGTEPMLGLKQREPVQGRGQEIPLRGGTQGRQIGVISGREALQSKQAMQNMMRLMKQQVEICAKIYRDRTAVQLKEHAAQLQRLDSLLARNKQQLQEKCSIIKRLSEEARRCRCRNNLQFSDRNEMSECSPTNQKLSLSKRKSVSKIKVTSKDKPALSLKELSAKVVTLEVNSAQMLEAGQTQEKAVLRLHNKIEEVERQSIAYFAMKIKQCKKSVSEFISSRSNVLKGCEQKLEQVSNKLAAIQRQTVVPLAKLWEEIKEVKVMAKKAVQKVFEYDSYKITHLQSLLQDLREGTTQLALLQGPAEELQLHRNPSLQYRSIQSVESQMSNSKRSLVSEGVSKRKSMNYSQPLNLYKTDNMCKTNNNLRDSQRRGLLSKFRDYHEEEFEAESDSDEGRELRLEDEIAIEEEKKTQEKKQAEIQEENEREKDVSFENRDSQIIEEHSRQEYTVDTLNISTDLNQNLARFEEAIRHCTLPVRLEIDQTGYAKSADDGMYFLDENGDAFEFTTEDLLQLRHRGLIVS